MSDLLETSVLRIFNSKGEIIGTGFLVMPTLAITCYHVIQAANCNLGDEIQIRFQGCNHTQTARAHTFFEADDVALLEVATSDWHPVRLGYATNSFGKDFRAFGYPEGGSVEERWATGLIEGLIHIEGYRHNLLQLDGEKIDRGMSGAPIWDQTTGFVVGMVTCFDDLNPRRGASVPNIRLGYAITAETLRLLYKDLKGADICPYRGLDAFTEADTDYFYGRKHLVECLIESLKCQPRFLAVLGPSGSGKSSVVQAGLVPELRRGAISGSESWHFFSIRPGENPFQRLESAGLLNAESGVTAALRDWMIDHPQAHPVILVDQFEELFTGTPLEMRQPFLTQLTDLLVSDLQVTVILTMRDDFYAHFTHQSHELTQWLEKGLENIPLSLNRKELREMIIAPADLVGMQFDPGLVDIIIDDMTAGERDGASTLLPLLEFALTQLWEHRQEGVLTYEAYQKLGGVTGGLSSWADRTYRAIPTEQRWLVRHILTSLIRLGDEQQNLPATRCRLKVDELTPINKSEAMVYDVIKTLTDARLLMTSRQEVEITHEILLSSWPQLREWLKDDHEALRLREGIRDEARKWETAGRDESLLNQRGARLDQALGLLRDLRYPLNSTEQEYLAQCARVRDKEIATKARRRRLVITGVSTALIVIIAILVGWGWTSSQNSRQLGYQVATIQSAQALAVGEANSRATAQAKAEFQQLQAERQAQIALARQLSTQAQLIFTTLDSRQQTAVLLAAQAMKLFPHVEAAQILQNNTLALPVSYTAYESWVTAVAFSPDGRTVASGDGNGAVHLWDAQSGREVAHMTHGKDEEVTFVAFSPDGKYVITGGLHDSARVWDTLNGQEVARLNLGDQTSSVAFSPDGKYMVSGDWNGVVHVWEIFSGQEVAHMTQEENEKVTFVAFSSDGHYVISADENGNAQVWEALSGQKVARINIGDTMSAVAFSPDGKYMVTGGHYGSVKVWEVATMKVVASMAHGFSVGSVSFSPDGRYIISSGCDDNAYSESSCHQSTVRLWDAFSGQEVSRMQCLGEVSVPAISSDGRFVVLGCSDGTSRVWEVASGKEIGRLTHEGRVVSVAFSPDGRYVISGSEDGIARVWEPINGLEDTQRTNTWSEYFIAFSRDGRFVLSGSKDGTIKVWGVTSGQEVAQITLGGGLVSASISPDGSNVVSRIGDGTIRVWKTADGQEIARIPYPGRVTSLAFSPDRRFVLSAGCDEAAYGVGECYHGTARVWEVASGREIAHMTYLSEVSYAAFSPDGHYVLSAGDEVCGNFQGKGPCIQGIAQIWDPLSGQEVARMVHKGGVTSASFSPDGRYVVSGGGDGTAKVWEAASGQELAQMIHNGGVTSVAFSPDGRYVISGGRDGSARVWEAVNGHEIARTTYDWSVGFVTFSPDGRYVVSVGCDVYKNNCVQGTIRVWEAMSGQEIGRMRHDGSVNFATFSPDGHFIVSGTGDTTRVWLYRPEDLIADICRFVTRNLSRAEWQQYIGNALPYQAVCPNLPTDPEPTATP